MYMDKEKLKMLYNDFLIDESLLGIKNLLNKHGIIGRYQEDKWKSELYKEFGEEKLKSIFRKRLYLHTSKKSKEREQKKLIGLESLSEKLYKEFIGDETIFGLTTLFRRNKIGSKIGGHIRKILYDKYGKENVDRISFHRTAIRGHRFKGPTIHTEKSKQKISKSNKMSWKNSDESRRELSRKNMIGFCSPKSHSSSVGIKRTESRRTGKGWKPHTEEAKRKMSEIFFRKWKNGDYDNRVKSFSSKSQLELMKFIGHGGYTTESEYTINGKPYDIFVKEKNLIIEFNGTYWHLDPRIYDENYYDKSRNIYASELWKRDKQKLAVAKKLGYNVMVVWEKDWCECADKIKYVKSILC